MKGLFSKNRLITVAMALGAIIAIRKSPLQTYLKL